MESQWPETSEQTKAGGNCAFCLVIVVAFVGHGGAKRYKRFLKLSYGGKGKKHKQEELLWGAIKKLPKDLTTELL